MHVRLSFLRNSAHARVGCRLLEPIVCMVVARCFNFVYKLSFRLQACLLSGITLLFITNRTADLQPSSLCGSPTGLECIILYIICCIIIILYSDSGK